MEVSDPAVIRHCVAAAAKHAVGGKALIRMEGPLSAVVLEG